MSETPIHEVLEQLVASPEAVYGITPSEFERVLAALLKSFGFETTLTPQSSDGSRDIIARASSPIPYTLVAEAKRYARDRRVGIGEVRQLAGYLAEFKAEKGLLVATSHFTKDAIEYAKLSTNIELRDFDGLKQWLSEWAENQAHATAQSPKAKGTVFPHAEAFPRIARTIEAICSETEDWVTRADIVARLESDSEVQSMLEARGGTTWHIANAVDWFSQKITAGDSEYVNQFRRKKVDGKWAYIPMGLQLHDEESTASSSSIAGPLRVYIDSDAYSAEEKGELLSLISELYFLQSGDRLVIDDVGTAEPIPIEVGMPDGGMS